MVCLIRCDFLYNMVINVSGAPITTSHSQYRHPNVAGDLAYYPASGKNNANSKSFSDTGFGMQNQQAMRMSTSQNPYNFQQSHVSILSKYSGLLWPKFQFQER